MPLAPTPSQPQMPSGLEPGTSPNAPDSAAAGPPTRPPQSSPPSVGMHPPPGNIVIPTPNGMIVGQPMQLPPHLQHNMMQLQMMQAQMAAQLAAHNQAMAHSPPPNSTSDQGAPTLASPPAADQTPTIEQQLFQQHLQQVEQQRRQSQGPQPNSSPMPQHPPPGQVGIVLQFGPHGPRMVPGPQIAQPQVSSGQENIAANAVPQTVRDQGLEQDPGQTPANDAPQLSAPNARLASSSEDGRRSDPPKGQEQRPNQFSQEDHERLRSKAMACYTDSTRSVYVLSSPEGPKALLIAPEGQWQGTWPSEARPRPSKTTPNSSAGPSSRPSGSLSSHVARIRGLLNNEGGEQPAVAAEAPQPAAANGQELRDLVRVILPLGGHLWLLVRLLGFVWFFSHGASSTRTLILVAIASAVFFAQTGIFTPILTQLWGPLRRYFETFLTGNRAAEPLAPQEPSAEANARRLLAERQARGVPNRIFRGAERVLALFVASLVPGVGEQQVQAQAEAERRREEQERASREEQTNDTPSLEHENKGKAPMPSDAPDTAGSSTLSEKKQQ